MPFQQRTVDAAVHVLQQRHSARRFLIADEVGLGKTVVAGGVINRLSNSGEKPLRVFYIAPGHRIAQQNQDRLLPNGARKGEGDRLGLLPYSPPRDENVEVYALSPDTSFHTRGTGQKLERLRIQLLLEHAYPAIDLPEDLYATGSKDWSDYSKRERNKHLPTQRMIRTFKFFLREELRSPAQRVGQELEGLAKQRYRFFSRLRKVLALTLLQIHPPDLLILDEFQRYRDLLEPSEQELFQKVLYPSSGRKRPSVLLLSATPFKLLNTSGRAADSVSEYENLYKLLRFLSDYTSHVAEKGERLFKNFRSALNVYMEAEDTYVSQRREEAIEAKSNLERFLKLYISRTERIQFEHLESPDASDKLHRPIDLADEDFAMFKHLAEAFRLTRLEGHGREQCCHPGDAVSYWLSVPLPAQTLGYGYRAWQKSKKHLLNTPGPPCRIKPNGAISGSDSLGSPKLRRLQKLCPLAQLSLPWCAPSLPWWNLQGPWSTMNGSEGQKLLLFSHFRATPGAVAAIMSMSVENPREKRRPRLRPSGVIYSLFYPSPFLINEVNPQPSLDRRFTTVLSAAQKQMATSLARLGIKVVHRDRKTRQQRRNIWKLLLSLERQYDSSLGSTRCQQIQNAWKKITGDPLPHSMRIVSISRRELRDLAELALEGPGIVSGRAFHRHRSASQLDGTGSLEAQFLVQLTWKGLHTYFDDPVFLKKNAKRKAAQQLRDLVRDGCLEAVLDEHIWHSLKNPRATLSSIAGDLSSALQLSSGASSFHPARITRANNGKQKNIRIPCRAAISFASTERLDDGKAIRPDEIRKAFNSPFRPFLLTSTSVGQEGLDFHVWCDRIVHWDLCSTPLDLEQREGRVQRFLGLGVRRALAHAHGSTLNKTRLDSPWNDIEKEAERASDATTGGIVPWWVTRGMRLRKDFFLLEQSRDIRRHRELLTQRILYRLALGQPNPEEFLRELLQKGRKSSRSDHDLRELMLNLSPGLYPTSVK